MTIAGGGGVVEGTDAAFTLTASKPVLSADQPLNVSVSVSESGDQVASADEGTRTVSFALNATTAALSVPTVGDTVYQGASMVTAAIRPDSDYTVGPDSSGTVRVADDEPDLRTPLGAAQHHGAGQNAFDEAGARAGLPGIQDRRPPRRL